MKKNFFIAYIFVSVIFLLNYTLVAMDESLRDEQKVVSLALSECHDDLCYLCGHAVNSLAPAKLSLYVRRHEEAPYAMHLLRGDYYFHIDCLIDYFWIRHVDYVHKLSDGLSQENIDRLRLETRSCFDFSCEFIKEIAEEIALYNMSDLIEFFNRHRYFLDDVFDEHGDTLWHLAVVRKMFIVIQRLVVFGRLFNYSADKVNNLGYTPLHIVIFLGARDEFFRPKYCALIKILKGAGVDINRRSNFGLTALHLAVLYSLPNFVDALLAFDETEVDIPIESTSLGTEGFSVPISVGDTPMTLATKIGNRQIVRMLSCRSSVVETIGWSCCR